MASNSADNAAMVATVVGIGLGALVVMQLMKPKTAQGTRYQVGDLLQLSGDTVEYFQIVKIYSGVYEFQITRTDGLPPGTNFTLETTFVDSSPLWSRF